MDDRQQDLGNRLVESTWIRVALIVIALAAGAYLVKSIWDLVGFAFDVLIIIFLAWILSAVMRRLAGTIRGYVPRPPWAAVPLAYLVVLLPVIALISLLVPITLAQSVGLSEDLPEYAQRLSDLVARFNEFIASLGATGDAGDAGEDTLIQMGTAVSGWVQDNAFGIAGGTATILVQAIFCVALSVYMVVEGNSILEIFYRLLPSQHHARARAILVQLDKTFFAYLKGVSIVVAMYGIAITTVMLVAGLPFALPIGLSAGFIQLVPIVGEMGALGIPIAVALLTGSLTTAVLVAIALGSWSLFMNNVVLPRLLGGAVQMPGFFVLLAVVLGTRFAGAWGAVLGVPVAGFIYALIIAWSDLGEEHPVPGAQEGETNSATGDGVARARKSPRDLLSGLRRLILP